MNGALPARVRAWLRTMRAAPEARDARAAYRAWAARHAPTPEDLARMGAESGRFAYRPLISIITPVYNTDPRWLRACIDSVLRQAYPHWELCLCDDASTLDGTRAALAECTDSRIKILRLDRNAHISAASNAALALASGEFIALLDHDDALTPDALFEVVRHLNEAPDTDVLYSDEDKLDPDGGVSDAYFKPDWSPEHLLSAMYTCHLTVARRSLVNAIGGFRIGYEGSQDHDLMLRLSEATTRIRHVPKILYHWRRTPGSTASTGTEKSWANEAGMRALEDTMRRRGVDAAIVPGGVPGLYRVRFAIVSEPLVSIVVVDAESEGDAGAAARCAARVRAATAYPHYEIVIADGASTRTIQRVNAAVQQSRGAHLVFLDASLDVMNDEWLSALLEYSQQEAVGAVGGKIQYPDGRLRHAGLVLGVAEGVGRALHQHPAAGYGYFSSAIAVRNYSAVSNECLMTRRDVFDRVGGFDKGVPWSVADVDYCLRAIRTNRRVVFTPYARLQTSGAPARPMAPDAESMQVLRGRWGAVLERDPHYNPNLDAGSADYQPGK